jgi:hypothetical protein
MDMFRQDAIAEGEIIDATVLYQVLWQGPAHIFLNVFANAAGLQEIY